MKVLLVIAVHFLIYELSFAATTVKKRSAQPPKPELPSGCYDGSIHPKTCCIGITHWWVHLPDPENCQKFYHCDNGKAVHKDCAGNLHWSIKEDHCEWPEIANCKTKQLPPLESPDFEDDGSTSVPNDLQCLKDDVPDEKCCNNYALTKFPNRKNCSSYYQCEKGVVVLKHCAVGLHFNKISERCDFPNTAQCVIKQNEPDVIDEDAISLPKDLQCLKDKVPDQNCCKNYPLRDFPNKKDCSSYYHCEKGVVLLKRCPNGLHFNKNIEKCDLPNNEQCIIIPQLENPDFEDDNSVSRPVDLQCFQGDIPDAKCCKSYPLRNFPNKKNCTSYYHCEKGVVVLQRCPNWLHFNKNLEKCDLPNNAQCIISKPEEPDFEDNDSVNRPVDLHCFQDDIPDAKCCKNYSLRNFPNKKDCSSYYHCANGVLILKKCPIGLHYNNKTQTCDLQISAQCSVNKKNEDIIVFPSDSHCYEQDVPDDNCCQISSRFPDKNDCSFYYECENNIVVLRQCSNGLHFNKNSRVCTYPNVAQCGIIQNSERKNGPSQNDESFRKVPVTKKGNMVKRISKKCLFGVIPAQECCKGVPYWQNVILQNNANCHSFIQCVHEKPMVRFCPDNLWWSTIQNRCEFKESATCIW